MPDCPAGEVAVQVATTRLYRLQTPGWQGRWHWECVPAPSETVVSAYGVLVAIVVVALLAGLAWYAWPLVFTPKDRGPGKPCEYCGTQQDRRGKCRYCDDPLDIDSRNDATRAWHLSWMRPGR